MRTLLRGPVHGRGSEPATMLVDDGRIAWIEVGDVPDDGDLEIVAEDGELIAPGFVDLQVNGAGGYDAMGGTDAIGAISELLPRFGVTSFLPTAISCPLAQARAFLEAVAGAPAPGARILGGHLEGPFLNPAFLGAHDPDALIDPSSENVDLLLAARPKMVTLAPELPGAMAAIKRLHTAGVLVAAGHSDADYDCGRRSIDAGVRFGTHLYNAMRPEHHRRPGLAGALLSEDRVTVGVIADGEHLHDAMIAQVIRMKSPARVALTTDQTAAAGAPAGPYRLGGRDVVSDGHSVRLEDGTLAGSVATMDQLVRRVAGLPGLTVTEAVAMASRSPADAIGEGQRGRLQPGAHADLVILDRDLTVRLTMVGGRVCYQR